MKKLAAGLVAAALAVVGVACGGDGASGDVSDALLTAAKAAEDAETAHVDMTVEISLGGQDIALEASGEFNFAEEIGSMTMTAAGGVGMPSAGQMEMVFDGTYMYVKGAAFDPALAGKEWGRVDLSSTTAARTTQFNQDPTAYLDWLRGAGGDVEEVGQEEIDGTETTHYRADLSIDSIVDQAPDEEAAEAMRAGFAVFGDVESFPLEVWVGDDGLPRRINIVLEGEGGTDLATDVTVELSDYGVDVEVEPPTDYKELDTLAG